MELLFRNCKQFHIPHPINFLIGKRLADVLTYGCTKFRGTYISTFVIAEKAQFISPCQQIAYIDCSRLFEGADTPF